MGISETIKDILIAMAGDIVGLTIAKRLFEKKDEGDKDKKAESASVSRVVADGILSLSDEAAFTKLLGLLVKEDPSAAEKVFSFLSRELLSHNQKRVFRVVVAKMAEDSHIKASSVIKEYQRDAGGNVAFDKKGAPIVTKETKSEEKTNLAIEFLKSFAALRDDDERLKVCEAGGITTTVFDYLADGLKQVRKVAEDNDKYFAEGEPLGDSAAAFARSSEEFKKSPSLSGLADVVKALFDPLLKKP